MVTIPPVSEDSEGSQFSSGSAADRPLVVRDFRNHARDWRDFRYVYPVLSRRSQGLSIGVNLNPDAACNFDCIYCQVDRTKSPVVRELDLVRLEDELRLMLQSAVDGAIFDEPEFRQTPDPLRRLNDIAFSGDGEPTTCSVFAESVRLVARLKSELDAGTEEYYRRINRPNYPLTHVIENITHAARARPIVIQALFMRVDETPPTTDEIAAFCDRLDEIRAAGGRIKLVQVYTVARRPAESCVTSLSTDELAAITRTVARRTSLPVESFGG